MSQTPWPNWMPLASFSIPTSRLSTAPHRWGRAMVQMASVFGEQGQRWAGPRPGAGQEAGGRPKVSAKVEVAVREHLNAGHGILKVAALVGCGSGTVQRVKREMVRELAGAA